MDERNPRKRDTGGDDNDDDDGSSWNLDAIKQSLAEPRVIRRAPRSQINPETMLMHQLNDVLASLKHRVYVETEYEQDMVAASRDAHADVDLDQLSESISKISLDGISVDDILSTLASNLTGRVDLHSMNCVYGAYMEIATLLGPRGQRICRYLPRLGKYYFSCSAFMSIITLAVLDSKEFGSETNAFIYVLGEVTDTTPPYFAGRHSDLVTTIQNVAMLFALTEMHKYGRSFEMGSFMRAHGWVKDPTMLSEHEGAMIDRAFSKILSAVRSSAILREATKVALEQIARIAVDMEMPAGVVLEVAASRPERVQSRPSHVTAPRQRRGAVYPDSKRVRGEAGPAPP